MGAVLKAGWQSKGRPVGGAEHSNDGASACRLQQGQGPRDLMPMTGSSFLQTTLRAQNWNRQWRTAATFSPPSPTQVRDKRLD
ncbi:hypothetical protein GGTG_11776 [Gaeumannomyces tritici R3-111a-1]|uniref:Uncharacterized protein n=1 Tax=Gaeumannomyces tritici (strain R3-111a-1) TaxID=644352 RepID=J3PE53_GAET3|nr:hypothetical protein GGTG_11776 [Gaeumannomyces tritici R3-111a-1]EJT70753.1 hypothetical protein GGTG_11776 [Gaeumannomyces tritici R3-111a-1]